MKRLSILFFMIFLCSCRTITPIEKWNAMSLDYRDRNYSGDYQALNMRVKGESRELISLRPLGIDLFSSRNFINHDESYSDAMNKAPDVVALIDVQYYWDSWRIPFLGYSVSKEIVEGTPVVLSSSQGSNF